MREKLRHLWPWLVAAGALGYVFWAVPLRTVAAVLTPSRAAETALVVGLGVIVLFLADSLALARIYAIFGLSITFRDVVRLRGLSYVLAAVNYHLGQGGMVYLLERWTKAGAARAAGCVLGAMAAQLAALGLVAAGGVLLAHEPSVLRLAPYAWGIVGAVLAGLVLVAWAPGFLRRFALTGPVVEAGPWGFMRAMAWRMPHLASLFGLHLVALAVFGIHVPPAEALVRLSALFFVVALPVSVQGLGTGQVAALSLFAPFSPQGPQVVVAYSLSTWAFAVVAQLGLGFFSLVRHRALLGDARPASQGGILVKSRKVQYTTPHESPVDHSRESPRLDR